MTTQSEFQNALFKKYNMVSEDYFRHPSFNFTILTRSGIEKVQAGEKINITYDVINVDIDNVVIKATATKDGQIMESFGEASPKNCKNPYPIAVAEKRAMARAVLKLTGAYSQGLKYEEESDDFKKPKEAPVTQLSKAMDAIQRGECTAEEAIDRLEELYLLPETWKYQVRKLKEIA